MGVYQKGGTQNLWWSFTDAQGKRQWMASGFVVGQEKEADRAFGLLQRGIEAERALLKSEGAKSTAPEVLPTKGVTLGMYARHWLRQRLKDKPQAAKEDKWKLERHVLPALEQRLFSEFAARHARGFVMELKARRAKDKEGKTTDAPLLAPRSIRSIWSTLHNMMDDAAADGFFQANPCILKDGDLPPANEDKDPEWRATAVYSRAEVVQLISDERLSFYRRVRHGMLFLAGLRPSEAFALRIRHYDRTTEFLGRLDLMRAFNTALRAEKALKVAAKRRLIPVHPTLAGLLGQWLLSGWEAHVGRKPTPDDLLIPNEKGGHTRVDTAYDDALEDQEMLGWRKRRLYDSRRTFISLAIADKANKELLRWVTHGPKARDVMDLYTSIPWEEICHEVAKLKVSVQVSGRIVELRRASGGPNRDSQCDSPEFGDKMLSHFDSRHRDSNPGPTDYKPVPISGRARPVAEKRADPQGLSSSGPPPKTSETGTAVTLSRTAITEALEDAGDAWEVSHDVAGLRQRLKALLSALEATP